MGASTTFWAPVHRALARVALGASASAFPLNAAPSLDFLGNGLQDHRLPAGSRGSSNAQPSILGWYGTEPLTCNYAPAAAAVNNIAAAANPTSGTPLTLVSSSGAGVLVLSAAAPAVFPLQATPQVTAGICIDSLPTLASFGSGGNVNTSFYNRATNVGRAVSVTGVASGSGGTVTIKGLDAYGYPQTQTITLAAGANTVNTTKTFKVITSVTPNFTDTHTLSVGTADIFGFGILASFFGDVTITWNNTQITGSTGFVAADTTSPATATTRDVRGTYAVQSASDGTKRLMMKVTPSLMAILANPTTGLFGVTPG